MPELLDPSALFKCMADETRLRIALLIVAEGELCVCELMAALDDSQPKISRHLAQLRACGLLLDRRQGQWVYYRLHPQLAPWAQGLLQLTLEANEGWIKDNRQALRDMRRPERQTTCN